MLFDQVICRARFVKPDSHGVCAVGGLLEPCNRADLAASFEGMLFCSSRILCTRLDFVSLVMTRLPTPLVATLWMSILISSMESLARGSICTVHSGACSVKSSNCFPSLTKARISPLLRLLAALILIYLRVGMVLATDSVSVSTAATGCWGPALPKLLTLAVPFLLVVSKSSGDAIGTAMSCC